MIEQRWKASALSRRSLLGNALAWGASSAGLLRSQRSAAAEAHISQSKPNKVPYGAAVNGTALRNDVAYRNTLAQSCDLLVPEGALKWGPIRPTPHEFQFLEADFILDFAKQNNLEFRGHTLVWHGALPPWVEETVKTQQIANAQLELHIKTVVSRYKGRILSWDVVNEPISDDPTSGEPLRPSVWTRHLGADYVEFAFRRAHEIDPAARLYLNEYDIEYAGPRFDAKRNALLSLIYELKNKDVPLHGLGIQGHLDPRFAIDRKRLQAFLKETAGFGLEVMITEMDVPDESLPADPNKRDEITAGLVREFLETVFEVVRPAGLITWGISDKYTWVPIYRKRNDGLPNRPLPFDSQMRPKRMFAVIKEFTNRSL